MFNKNFNPYFQFIDPSFHSKINPINKIKNKVKLITNHNCNFICNKIIGQGRIILISISKIKNINIIEKKWIENLTRGLENGSNPHSKGDIFSRSFFLCKLIKGRTFIIKVMIKVIMNINNISIKIILVKN